MHDLGFSGVVILVSGKRGDFSVKCLTLDYVDDRDDFRISLPGLEG